MKLNRETLPSDASAGNVGEMGELADADLVTILDAWNDATTRLQQSHELLRDEVNRLSNELETKNRELARKNRLADLGQMAAHVAHEVRNGLVPLTLYLSLLKRMLDEPASVDIVKKIESGFTALEVTVNDLLQFTSDREPTIEHFELRPVIDEILMSMQPQASAQGIDYDVDVPAGLKVRADVGMIRRGLLNLILNAFDAMPDGGSLVITAWQGANRVEIEIADEGPGLGDLQKTRLFEPFYSTKNGGTGLGLTIVAKIAEAHGGTIHAMNCPEGGAAFTLSLPRKAMEAAA